MPAPDEIEVVVDRGIAARTLRLSHVRDLLGRCGGHGGRARLAALLEREQRASTLTDSIPEERMLALLRGAGLPEPPVNVPFQTWKLDFYWPDARLAVEVDSYRFHGSRYRFERDRRKDNALRRANIDVMRVVDHEITGRSHALIADLTRALTRRGAL